MRTIDTQLRQHAQSMEKKQTKDFFESDKDRVKRFTHSIDDKLIIDFSKNPITDETIALMMAWAKEAKLEQCRDNMFTGVHINETEDRAVLHPLLRYNKSYPLPKNLESTYADIKKTLKTMEAISEAIRQGKMKGITGKPFKSVVHIGIGGSYLGVQMVFGALKDPKRNDIIPVHFIANGDMQNAQAVLAQCAPEETLIVVVSKTFTTQETLDNAHIAKKWLTHALGEKALASHCIAISTAIDKCVDFGIHRENIIGFWDFVGGRFSTWSAVGTTIAISLGWQTFQDFLNGAAMMDKHFLETAMERNIPMMMGFIGVWMRNYRHSEAHVVIPYDYYLRDFPMYLQQLEMESNGKSIDKQGKAVAYPTTPILIGQAGTDCQHSFFQLLHQGTVKVSIDLIGVANPKHDDRQAHNGFTANFFAQGEAFLKGKTAQAVEEEMEKMGNGNAIIEKQKPFRVVEGNRATTSMLLKEISGTTMGMMMALYEHKTFVQSVLWNIYAFDQFGVELGKKIASVISKELDQKEKEIEHDPSTKSLMDIYTQWQK